ncbi:MAG TPA: sigma-70 family RNA polymerase sigma factor [Puia sp.]|nr:sigma-70 family RNA polymerase sigma factor [Puia sp.]
MNEITAIKEGIEPAFEKVYRAYHAKTFRFFLKRVRLHETAKELAQQTFIKLWRSRHTLSESISLDIQLFTMAGGVFIDHLRKQASRNRLHVVLREEQNKESMSASGASLETKDYFSVIVSGLPPVRKQVMLLKAKHGFSNKEIASELSISEKTVEGHVTKAIRQIRAISSLLFILLFTLLAG